MLVGLVPLEGCQGESVQASLLASGGLRHSWLVDGALAHLHIVFFL